ncbi:benzoate 4-monooxygenase cytochrome P450 [Purpureocillium lavendulum]|uniref:Benzoate 4-monooxygenase cytochrome P450 n=1 Tax=Purpureocillium lavendulum TaxID=1247861 RepID=A0AB34FKV6_9HYPO|nr:benzoate 4-monooxygenase cytochrome P450 [Purpureocillium lavendulum]
MAPIFISIYRFLSKLDMPFLVGLPVIVVILHYGLLRPLLYGRLRHVPGPWHSKISSLLLAIHDLSYRRNDQILQWHRLYGPVIRIAPNEVSVATLQATKDVYCSSRRWEKSGYFDHFMGYGTRSVFATKPYEEHRKKRRLTSSFYRASTIYKLPEIERHIQERSLAVLSRIQPGQATDVYSLTDWYALDNITFLVLGPQYCTHSVDHDCLERHLLMDLKYQQFVGPLRVRFPQLYKYASRFLATLSRHFGFLVADDEFASWCQSRFQTAANDPAVTQTHSLLQHLSNTDKAHIGEGTADLQYIGAEVLDNINAAEATIAVTATYLIWRLTEAPQWQRRIRAELSRLPIQEDGSLTFADVNDNVPSLEACLREVYRLHPASSGRAERIVPKGGHYMSGIYLPENTIVTTSVQALHRDEAIYSDPNLFVPERWLDQDEETWKLRDAQLIPFGYGGRICLGKALATMELKLLMARLYRNHETVMTASSNAESMRQCSTHDAVPKGLKCVVQFQMAERGADRISG